MPTSRPLLAALASIGALALLTVLTVLVGAHLAPLVSLDHYAARAAYDAGRGHPGRVQAWSAVSTWGQPWVMRGLLLAGACVALVRRRIVFAVWLVVLALLEAVVAPAAKVVLDRPRPHWADPLAAAAGSSYPSGHATAAFTVATAVVLVAAARPSRGRAVRAVVVLLVDVVLLVATLVAASRIFLGVHYLTDVAAGALLGAALATGCWGGVVLVAARARARRIRPQEGRSPTSPPDGC